MCAYIHVTGIARLFDYCVLVGCVIVHCTCTFECIYALKGTKLYVYIQHVCTWGTWKNIIYPVNRSIVVVLEIVNSPPCLHPLLEQVLVVGVPPGAQGDGAVLPEVPGVGVDEYGHKALGLGEVVNMPGHLGYSLLVLGVAGGSAEVPELQLDGGHLGGGAVRAPLWCMACLGLQIDVRIRNTRGGVK